MQSTYLSHSLYVLSVLCLLIFFAIKLSNTRRGKPYGAALIVIILGAIAANLGAIPSASNSIPLYSGIFKYLAPLSIFLLTLDANLSKLKDAGLPMLLLFLLGTVATTLGIILAFQILSPESILGEFAAPISGMIAGTYSGGSINFNAIALHYNVMEQGLLFAGTVAVDNVLTALWIVMTIIMPKFLNKIWKSKAIKIASKSSINQDSKNQNLTLTSFIVLSGSGFFTLYIAEMIGEFYPAFPSIITVTTIALILAQVPYFHKLPGAQSFGLLTVYLFLVVIGAFCELEAVWDLGNTGIILLSLLGLTILIHGVVILLFGGIFFRDWEMISIASQANIGGGPTAMALAETFNRKELILPAILVGTLGNALGTYVGFFVVYSLI